MEIHFAEYNRHQKGANQDPDQKSDNTKKLIQGQKMQCKKGFSFAAILCGRLWLWQSLKLAELQIQK